MQSLAAITVTPNIQSSTPQFFFNKIRYFSSVHFQYDIPDVNCCCTFMGVLRPYPTLQPSNPAKKEQNTQEVMSQ